MYTIWMRSTTSQNPLLYECKTEASQFTCVHGETTRGVCTAHAIPAKTCPQILIPIPRLPSGKDLLFMGPVLYVPHHRHSLWMHIPRFLYQPQLPTEVVKETENHVLSVMNVFETRCSFLVYMDQEISECVSGVNGSRSSCWGGSGLFWSTLSDLGCRRKWTSVVNRFLLSREWALTATMSWYNPFISYQGLGHMALFLDSVRHKRAICGGSGQYNCRAKG